VRKLAMTFTATFAQTVYLQITDKISKNVRKRLTQQYRIIINLNIA